MMLNWFSPLAPAPTDIAHYTTRLLPVLRRHASITLWTDQSGWDPAIEAYARVRPYRVEDMPWAELNRADLSVYHVGNDARFHRAIWAISRLHPGLVVLHDPRMQDFFVGIHSASSTQRDVHVAHMARAYGAAGIEAARAFWGGTLSVFDLAIRHPLSGLACENALAVLVHSRHVVADLRGELACPIVVANLPYPASTRRPDPPRAAPPYRIVVFGYLGRNRGLEHLLRALANVVARNRFRLDVYGSLADPDAVHQLTAALGLGDVVRYHGETAPAALDRCLDGAHLAVNLRYPTMGESSGSQLRIWDHALPSIVSRVDWYATLPEAAVSFVRLGHETADLEVHLQTFLDDPARFARMGEHGRRVLEADHAPEVYVDAILGVARNVWRYHRRAVSGELARHAGREMGVWLAPEAPVAPYRTVALEIDALFRGETPSAPATDEPCES